MLPGFLPGATGSHLVLELLISFLFSSSSSSCPLQIFGLRPTAKPTLFIPNHSSRCKTDFPTIQAIPVDTKPTSSGERHSSRYKTDVLQYMPFQSIQNGLPRVQAIPVDTKQTSSTPSHYSRYQTDFLRSTLFRTMQKPTSNSTSHYS